MYVSPSQMATKNSPGWLSHQFEHLACFFPGLLALGAHTLPLSSFKLPTAIFDSLADEGIRDLSEFSLKDLHMWAAEGLAQTCWIMYADTATGLGPEMVAMQLPEDGEPVRWVDVLKSWKKSGSRGIVPGLRPAEPLGHMDDLPEKMKKRDYFMRDERYLLRPEVGPN
jgi:mannosyl-oligosaccharide alpha-1,2-mannosidase